MGVGLAARCIITNKRTERNRYLVNAEGTLVIDIATLLWEMRSVLNYSTNARHRVYGGQSFAI